MLFSPFFFYSSGDHRDLHSFPTRRSSDLSSCAPGSCESVSPRSRRVAGPWCSASSRARRRAPRRSEEHTSELQSHHDLVCRLLLEKKKESQRNCQLLSACYHADRSCSISC